jgi:hypothetical protein
MKDYFAVGWAVFWLAWIVCFFAVAAIQGEMGRGGCRQEGACPAPRP